MDWNHTKWNFERGENSVDGKSENWERGARKKIASFITIHVEFKFFDGTCVEADADMQQ